MENESAGRPFTYATLERIRDPLPPLLSPATSLAC